MACASSSAGWARLIHLTLLRGETNMPAFLYEATDRDGKHHAGRVQAENLPAARYRLELQGCSEIRFHTDPRTEAQSHAEGVVLAEGVTPTQEMAARLTRGGSLADLRSIYAGNWIVWLPTTIWALWSLYAGPPFDVVKRLSFILAVVGLLFPLWAALPSRLYARMLDAQAWARWDELIMLCRRARQLRKFFRLGSIQIDAEFRHAAAVAAQGDLRGALAAVRHHGTTLPKHIYLGRLASIYGAAQDWQGMADLQAEAVELSGRETLEIIDHATTLAWRLGHTEEAAALLEEVRDTEKTIMAEAYFNYASGIVSISRGHHAAAVEQLSLAADALGASGNNALLEYMADYTLAHLVLALAGQGQIALARSLLSGVLPRLKAFRDLALTRRCADAVLGKRQGQ